MIKLEAEKIIGFKSEDISNILGYDNGPVLIHRDNLVVSVTCLILTQRTTYQSICMSSVDWLESPTLCFGIADSSTKNYALKKMAEEIRKREKQIL